ncbi:hypothetical protein Tco_0076129 [Tanacetum coccineum]
MGAIWNQHRLCPSRISNESEVQFLFDDTEWNARTHFQWITPLTPPMLEVVTALAAEEEHSTSPNSRAASSARDAQSTDNSQGTADVQGTADFQGTDETQHAAHDSNLQGTAASPGAAAIPQSPNDYTPTDTSQTSGGMRDFWISML